MGIPRATQKASRSLRNRDREMSTRMNPIWPFFSIMFRRPSRMREKSAHVVSSMPSGRRA